MQAYRGPKSTSCQLYCVLPLHHHPSYSSSLLRWMLSGFPRCDAVPHATFSARSQPDQRHRTLLMEPAWRHKVEPQKSRQEERKQNREEVKGKKGDAAWYRAENMGLVSPARDTACVCNFAYKHSFRTPPLTSHLSSGVRKIDEPGLISRP